MLECWRVSYVVSASSELLLHFTLTVARPLFQSAVTAGNTPVSTVSIIQPHQGDHTRCWYPLLEYFLQPYISLISHSDNMLLSPGLMVCFSLWLNRCDPGTRMFVVHPVFKHHRWPRASAQCRDVWQQPAAFTNTTGCSTFIHCSLFQFFICRD